MVKTIRLLGMEIENYSLHEEVLKGESFYNNGELNVIKTVSMQTLSQAVDNPLVREGIEQATMVIVEDKEILTEAGIYSNQRLWDANEHAYMKEFLKRANRNNRRFFLVAESGEEVQELMEALQERYEKLQIVGQYALESCGGDYDDAINEINTVAPQVVLSVVRTPLEEEFLAQARSKVSAELWYSIGEHFQEQTGGVSLLTRLKRLIHTGKFKTTVQNYEEKNE